MTAPIVSRPSTPPPSPAAGAFLGEVHPYADAFPMMSDEDQAALAADIKANGLRYPPVIDRDGVLLDGRNRLAACALAGVEPTFIVFDGDPVAFIMSANLQRRDLPQRVKAYFAVDGLFLRNSRSTQSELAQVAGVSQGDIAKAMIVRKYAPEAFAAVIAREMKPESAYEAAKAVKESLSGIEKQRSELQAEAPDLLRKGLTLEEAYAAYQARTADQRKAEAERAEWLRKLRESYANTILGADSITHPAKFADLTEALSTNPLDPMFDAMGPDAIRRRANALLDLAQRMEDNDA